ncbi:MAG: hypothetical protein IKJ05_07920, partial [Oscillospiraceae bacterium]|nr:hypothetical protein [Oscillospiraceae bacterium]
DVAFHTLCSGGVWGNRNPHVLVTFAPKVTPAQRKNIVLTPMQRFLVGHMPSLGMTIPQSASLTAPFTQGSLYFYSNCSPYSNLSVCLDL